MPPSADTLLSPAYDFDDDRDSSPRSLDDVGAFAVLGAMVEQRKRPSSISPPMEVDDADADSIATQRRFHLAPNDDIFQKIR